MPTFDTPQPVSARLSLGFVVANVRVTASDRTDTTVDVQPMDASSKADVKVAEQTRIEYADGRLEVRAPKLSTLFGRTGSVDVTITLPSGSRLRRDPARPGRRGQPPQRQRRRHCGPRRWRRRDHRQQRGCQHPPDRRTGDGQELQRRHLDRRGHRRATCQRSQRRGHRRPGTRRRHREDRQRQRTDRRGHQRCRDAGDRRRLPRGRHPHGHRRLARPQHRRRTHPQRAGRGRRTRQQRGNRRSAGPHLCRRHHRPPHLSHPPEREEKAMATTHRPAIEATGLRKSYGEKLVLGGIDLTVPEGTTFALLGPNGAGKTTAVNILSTLIGADGGDVRVAGHDVAREPDAVRDVIGVTGQFSAVDGLLTGEENLALMADLRHLDRTEGRRRSTELLERFDLVDAARKPTVTYAGGMRRRLDLAMTLIGNPRIIFLDEPTTGLDPRSRRDVWKIIRTLVAAGVTVFLTTQYLEEADQLADRIALLDHGRLIAQGTPEQLKRLVPGGHVVLRFTDHSG